MWQQYFKVVKLKPGRVITPLFGELDLSNPNIPLEKIIALFEADAYYLQLTDLGKKILYTEPSPKPAILNQNPETQLPETQLTEPEISNQKSEPPIPAKNRTKKNRKNPA